MPTYHLLTPMVYSSGEIGSFCTHIVDHVTGCSILSVCVYFYSRGIPVMEIARGIRLSVERD